MSGIGNYIHSKNETYVKYGLTINNPAGASQYNNRVNILEKQKDSIKMHSSSNSSLKGLENFLNNLMYPKMIKSKSVIDNETFLNFQTMVQQVFQEKYPAFAIDFADGHVYRTKVPQTLSVSNLQGYAMKLETLIQKLDAKNATDSINQIKNILSEIQTIVNSNNPDAQVTLSEIDPNLQNNINRAFGLASYNKKMIGVAFEIWLSAASLVGQNYQKKITQDMIENFISEIEKNITGGQTSKSFLNLSKIDGKYVDKEVLKQELKSGHWSISENLDVAYVSSQQKSDLTFNWKGKDIFISAKNYSLQDENQRIHLLSGSSLLQILQTCSVSYANHYLNIVGTKDSALQEAHNSLKVIALASALSGQGLKEAGLADTFIINARKKHHIFVFTLKDLFNAYSNNPEEIEVKGNLDVSNNIVNGAKKSKVFAQERITNLLAQAHANKLSLTISQKILTN